MMPANSKCSAALFFAIFVAWQVSQISSLIRPVNKKALLSPYKVILIGESAN